MIDKKLISIDEIVQIFNISKSTVNYYTNLGLLRIADKRGNKRLYDKAKTKKTLDKMTLLRRQGYTLRLIQQSFNHGRLKGL